MFVRRERFLPNVVGRHFMQIEGDWKTKLDRSLEVAWIFCLESCDTPKKNETGTNRFPKAGTTQPMSSSDRFPTLLCSIDEKLNHSRLMPKLNVNVAEEPIDTRQFDDSRSHNCGHI